MATAHTFDVLVIGSGASGLAAAVSAEHAGARVALATKTSIQANNSSKAQGGIQAAFGDDDSPDLHAEDVMRSSHDTADPQLVEVLTSEAPSAIHWLEELGCAFTRENGGYRLARCGGASRKRLLQVGDRTGHAITKALRESFEAGGGTPLPDHALLELAPGENGWVASFGAPGRRSCGDRCRCGRARRRRPLLRGGGRARRAVHQSPERDRRGDGHRARSRLRGPRPRRPSVPPERRRVAPDDAGLLHPRDDPGLRRRAAQRRRRGVHRLARPS